MSDFHDQNSGYGSINNNFGYGSGGYGSAGNAIRGPTPEEVQTQALAKQRQIQEEARWSGERARGAAERERSQQLRAAALEAALRANLGDSARQIVSDAREFEAFLKGEIAESAK